MTTKTRAKATEAAPRRTAETMAAENGGADLVSLHLAHPIAPRYQAGLGLEQREEDYLVGEEISVAPNVARAIINAGFAQVDPENPEEVAQALGISDEEAAVVVDQMLGETPPVPPGNQS